MVYARIKASPNKSRGELARYGGAMVNCWINSDDIEDSVSVARRIIEERGWQPEVPEEARRCLRQEFPKDSRRYFDQAITDDEVLVFYTYQVDDPNA